MFGSSSGSASKPRSAAGRQLGPNAVACKCQICDCGSHQCPKDRHIYELTPYELDNLRTGYQRDYPAHPMGGRATPTRGPRSEGLAFGQGRFEGQTTCQSDFRPPGPGARGTPAKPPQGDSGLINGGNNSRSFSSESQQQFSPKGRAVRESYAPVGMQHTTGAKFEGASTTASDFHAHSGAKPSTPFREQPTRSGDREDRDFQTEAALKFVAHTDAQRRQNFAPPPRNAAHSLPFEGESTSKGSYKPWTGAAPARSAAPKTSSLTPEAETRDFRSQNAMAFEPKGFQARESFKPRQDTLRQNGPFAGVSTSKADFTGARGEPSRSVRPSVGLTDTIGVALGSPDDRQWLSESRGQYVPAGGPSKRESYAPKGIQHTTGARFEGVSTTAADFHAHSGAKPSTPFREQPTRNSQPDDRDFRSETQLKYPAHAGGAGVRQNFAPPPRNAAHSQPFEGQSTTKADFKPWNPRGDCPANALPNDGVRGADGHTLYRNANGKWEPHLQQ